MPDSPIIKTDQGAINARILAREAKVDFRRVEAASLKVVTHLTSAEAKRMFVRMFSTLQLNSHFISVIARTRLDHADIEKIEAAMRQDMEAATDSLNQAIDGAEALFKANGISSVATYDAKPLEIEVGLLSSSGRRFLEVINKMDQLMPLLQTLEIHEVLTTHAVDVQRAAMKRQIRAIANSARRLATGLRRRMNAMALAEAVQANQANQIVAGKSDVLNGAVADESPSNDPSFVDGPAGDLSELAQVGEPLDADAQPAAGGDHGNGQDTALGHAGDDQIPPAARRPRRSASQQKGAVGADAGLASSDPKLDGDVAAQQGIEESQP